MADTGMTPKNVRVVLKQIFGEKINEEYELTGTEVGSYAPMKFCEPSESVAENGALFPKASIGRSPKCDITLSCPNVSRKHCTLMYTNGVWSIIDNKSQNGTYVNGRKLGPAEKFDLQYGDIVFLGPPSEMPQAFSYVEHHLELMETDDDDDDEDIIELPPVKRKGDQNVNTPVKKLIKSSNIEILETENNKRYESVASGSESHSQDLPKDNFKTENLEIHNNITPIKKNCLKESAVPKFKDSTNEISSTGSDNDGNSESLLDEGVSSFVDPTISYYPEKHWELDKRKSRNSQKSKELEVKLALLSEEIKALQESKLELLKKYEDVCEKNKVLDKQLTNKQNKLEEDIKQHEIKVKNEVKSELLKKFEEELVCNICTELFIKPIVLDCSHTFCEYCIKQWKKKKNDCPICRCKIKNTIRVRTLEEFIDKVLTTLTPEQRLIRENAKAQRTIAEQSPKPAPTPGRRRGGGNRRGRYSRSNVMNANISVEIVEEIVEPSRSHNLRRISRSNGNSTDTGAPNDLLQPTHSRTIRMRSRPNGNSSDTDIHHIPVEDSVRSRSFFPYVNEYDVEFRLPALSTMGFFY